MIHQTLRHACEAGGEVALHLRSQPGTRFHGHVQDLDDRFVVLYFASEAEGWRWTFPLDEVVACAQLINRPAFVASEPCALHPLSDRPE